MDEKIAKLQEIIDTNDNIVFFGGAGVSTESGIPDFRSQDGLYNQQYDYPPETIVSHTFFMNKVDEFYRFYKDKMIALEAEPNAAHKALAKLEEAGKLKAIITQNIDGLHEKAGSKEVYDIHGCVNRNYCVKCRKMFTAKDIMNMDGTPHCDDCGGLIKPDVVLYEEGLDQNLIAKSISAISKANVLIIGGTSLAVYPAAGFIDYFNGEHLVVINKSDTAKHVRATLTITEPIGEVFSQLKI
ncbi:MAG: NAD-dependent protein deacylase [Lachnospiraceae bacterium]|nr:NAD-dependent protein deacylase [Lachnospiraceae bacterium]